MKKGRLEFERARAVDQREGRPLFYPPRPHLFLLPRLPPLQPQKNTSTIFAKGVDIRYQTCYTIHGDTERGREAGRNER